MGVDRVLVQEEVLFGVALHLASRHGLDPLISSVLAGVDRIYGSDVAHVVVRDVDGALHVTGSGPLSDDVMLPVDEALLRYVECARGREIAVESGQSEHVPAATFPEAVSTVKLAPVVVEGRVRGVVWLGFRKTPSWDQLDWRFLGLVADQVATYLAQDSVEREWSEADWSSVAVDCNPDPVLVLDNKGIIRFANPAAAFLANDDGELVGQPARAIAALAGIEDALRPPVQEANAAWAHELATAGGKTYAMYSVQVDAQRGGTDGWVLFLQDISHFKRVNASMADFLGTVSHDMRSPLTFIRGYVEMLGMVGDLNERQTSFVEKISDGVTQMANMVEKILEAGKLDPETGDYQLNREPSDVVQMVQWIVESFGEAAAKKRLELCYSSGENIPIVDVDRAMLGSAVTNLIENAIKYTPEGGRVQVELECDNRQIVFRVVDNGFGIRQEDQAALFERHVRLHRKEWKRVKGTGLGLFIVRTVARRHGGDAWVESAEDAGSSFFLTIPLTEGNLAGTIQG